MPRTKRPTRKQEKTVEDDDSLKKLNKLVTEKKNKIDMCVASELKNLELSFKILLSSIKQPLLQKTIGQLKTELHLKEPSTFRGRNTRNSRSASRDDAPPSSSNRKNTGRRSRSADASARSMQTVSRAQTQRRRSRSVYKTPSYNKKSTVNYPVITPKVTPHTPLTVLRQPRAGEMVVSMSGSPVVVPSVNTMQSEEKANCNIQLTDGTMLSLQPRLLRQSQAYIPFSLMDSNVLHQLRTLKENLDKVVKLGEKAFK